MVVLFRTRTARRGCRPRLFAQAKACLERPEEIEILFEVAREQKFFRATGKERRNRGSRGCRGFRRYVLPHVLDHHSPDDLFPFQREDAADWEAHRHCRNLHFCGTRWRDAICEVSLSVVLPAWSARHFVTASLRPFSFHRVPDPASSHEKSAARSNTVLAIRRIAPETVASIGAWRRLANRAASEATAATCRRTTRAQWQRPMTFSKNNAAGDGPREAAGLRKVISS